MLKALETRATRNVKRSAVEKFAPSGTGHPEEALPSLESRTPKQRLDQQRFAPEP
jgi:hypothetical protein